MADGRWAARLEMADGRSAPFGEISTKFRRNFEFSTKFRVFDSSASVFFPSAGLAHGTCQGLGGLPGGPTGMWGVQRPAHQTDTGDGPGPESASGAGVARATPAAVCGPPKGMHAMCTGAESTGARVRGWAGTPSKHTRHTMRILCTQSEQKFTSNPSESRPPEEACGRLAARLMHDNFLRTSGVFGRHFLSKPTCQLLRPSFC